MFGSDFVTCRVAFWRGWGYGDVPADRYFTEPVQWSVDNDISNIGGNCFLLGAGTYTAGCEMVVISGA